MGLGNRSGRGVCAGLVTLVVLLGYSTSAQVIIRDTVRIEPRAIQESPAFSTVGATLRREIDVMGELEPSASHFISLANCGQSVSASVS
ncbi:MAG TPA: hypothetical protein VNN76_09880, partial [Bacteroidota bacterium]|nr:hypothetical protein [Bacteroidota bacterium]